jgi:DNA-binding NarL/FixJ family response regulator
MVRSFLVVDDDAALRGLIVRILRSRGHLVLGEAGSAADALVQTEVLRPDVALVDVGLPDADGFTVARRLRALGGSARVVLFSSDDDPTNVAAAERAGAVGFLPKDDLTSLALERLIEDEAGDDEH